MKEIAFVVTKPLQFIIAIAVSKQLNAYSNVSIVLTDDFFEAKKIHEKIEEVLPIGCIKKVLIYNSQKEAYRFLIRAKISTLIIDSDVGFSKWIDLIKIKLRNRSIKIAVYEEGIGTYRDDLYGDIGTFKRVKNYLFKIFGVGTHFGGNFLCEEIYLYRIEDYKFQSRENLKITKISNQVDSVLIQNREFIRKIFRVPDFIKSYGIKKQHKCCIYFSSWCVDLKIIEEILKIGTQTLVKLHPNIKVNPLTKFFKDKSVQILDSNAPAEILLASMSDVFVNVIVFHHGSSVVRYMSRKNIIYVDVSNGFLVEDYIIDQVLISEQNL